MPHRKPDTDFFADLDANSEEDEDDPLAFLDAEESTGEDPLAFIDELSAPRRSHEVVRELTV